MEITRHWSRSEVDLYKTLLRRRSWTNRIDKKVQVNLHNLFHLVILVNHSWYWRIQVTEQWKCDIIVCRQAKGKLQISNMPAYLWHKPKYLYSLSFGLLFFFIWLRDSPLAAALWCFYGLVCNVMAFKYEVMWVTVRKLVINSIVCLCLCACVSVDAYVLYVSVQLQCSIARFCTCLCGSPSFLDDSISSLSPKSTIGQTFKKIK